MFDFFEVCVDDFLLNVYERTDWRRSNLDVLDKRTSMKMGEKQKTPPSVSQSLLFLQFDIAILL